MRESEAGEQVQEFFTFLALCHKVVAEEQEDGTLKYQSPSPDEEALVKAAAKNEIVLSKVTKETYTIDILGNKKVYQVMKEFPFNSTRKKQSVIIKDDDDRYWIYVKGADSMMEGIIAWEDRDLEIV
jgi:magnesium-transporting ATPase (P-type)